MSYALGYLKEVVEMFVPDVLRAALRAHGQGVESSFHHLGAHPGVLEKRKTKKLYNFPAEKFKFTE